MFDMYHTLESYINADDNEIIPAGNPPPIDIISTYEKLMDESSDGG